MAAASNKTPMPLCPPILRRLAVLAALVVAALVGGAGPAGGEPDLFFGSRLPVDAAMGLRPKSAGDTGGQAVRVLPLSPSRTLDDAAATVDRLSALAPNTHSYLWATWEADGRAAAALAHVRYCAAEQDAPGWRQPHRRTFCATRVKGAPDPDSGSDPDFTRCATDSANVSTVPLGPLVGGNPATLAPGSGPCFAGPCAGAGPAQYDDLPVRSFVVLAEQDIDNPDQIVPLADYLAQTRPGVNWFRDNLVRRQSPFSKSIFPNVPIRFGEDGTAGSVLVSYRLANTLGDACEPGDAGSLQRAVDRTLQARAAEKINLYVTQAVESGVSMPPASLPEIVLIIAASFIALFGANASWYLKSVVLVQDTEFGYQILDHSALPDASPSRRPSPLLFAAATFLKVVLELLPIYFLLGFEIRAKNQLDVTGFEVLGVGQEGVVLEEAFHEMATALVFIVTQNTVDNLPLIATFCGLLTVLALVFAIWEFYFFYHKKKSVA